MASNKKVVRPLGSLRQSASVDRTPRYQAISSVYGDKQGALKLHGNAMSVPPPRLNNEVEKVEREAKTAGSTKSTGSKSDSGSSTKSQESTEKKELKESLAREKQLKHQITNLYKLIDDLREQLRQKEKTIDELQEKLKRQEEESREQLAGEKQSHSETRERLDKNMEELTRIQETVETLTREYEQKIQTTQEQMETKLAQVISDRDKDIALRDEKLAKLKKQMADALMGNSWERQQQLEELTKELGRIQEEADILRTKLKSYKTKQGPCANCQELTTKLNRLTPVLKDKDQTILELKTLCAKFEHQLMQQDELLKIWAETQGQKVDKPPN